MTDVPPRAATPADLRQWMRQAGRLMLAALVPAIVTAIVARPRWHQEPAAKDEMALVDALTIRPPVLWIDARPAVDFAKDHIPGALPLNEDEWSKLVPEVLHRWNPRQTVVVYCHSTGCDASGHVARRLRAAGVSPVHVLHGGWDAWTTR